MKIVVLNGSPKGDISVTMQYVRFLQKSFPQHDLKILNISQRFQTIEKDQEKFREVIDEVRSADGVLWAFPLYILLVHANYKRFIELIFERGVKDAFRGKYTASLSTSIHYFDHTAHNYINAICDDLDMRYVGAFSADMYDLLDEKKRQELTQFGGHLLWAIEKGLPTTKHFQKLSDSQFGYLPGDVKNKVDSGSKKVVVLTDSTDKQTNLGKMIDRFSSSFSGKIEVIDLNDVDIKGGCLGCIQCGYDYSCAYGNKDGFMEFYNTKVRPADILVLAGALKDRYLSSRWKLFFDRSFFNTHTPVWTSKQIGCILSGPLNQVSNLRQILEAWCEFQQGNLVDIITDEPEDSATIDSLLQSLAERLTRFAGEGYMKPATFLGVGGTKIFRDDIFGRLRFPFLADHRAYKKTGIYDFPQSDYKSRSVSSVMTMLTKIASMRKEIYNNRIKTEMIKPLQKIIEK
jgi:multimeric flavodoxin WrbA